jgi:hypothetical protein
MNRTRFMLGVLIEVIVAVNKNNTIDANFNLEDKYETRILFFHNN